jgi:hypothetical protein
MAPEKRNRRRNFPKKRNNHKKVLLQPGWKLFVAGVVLGRSVGAGVREAAANNMLHRIAEPTRNLAVGLVCRKFTIANSTIKQKSFGSTCTRLE